MAKDPDLPVYQIGTHQSKAYTGTAASITNATAAHTKTIRVVATTECYIAIGASPTATTSSVFMPALAIEYFEVPPSIKVSAIRVASSGTVHVTEMSS